MLPPHRTGGAWDIVLLEQITNGACFEGVNQQAFLIHVLANGVPLPNDLPPELSLLFRGLLARDRVQRWKWAQVQEWLEGKSARRTCVAKH